MNNNKFNRLALVILTWITFCSNSFAMDQIAGDATVSAMQKMFNIDSYLENKKRFCNPESTQSLETMGESLLRFLSFQIDHIEFYGKEARFWDVTKKMTCYCNYHDIVEYLDLCVENDVQHEMVQKMRDALSSAAAMDFEHARRMSAVNRGAAIFAIAIAGTGLVAITAKMLYDWMAKKDATPTEQAQSGNDQQEKCGTNQ